MQTPTATPALDPSAIAGRIAAEVGGPLVDIVKAVVVGLIPVVLTLLVLRAVIGAWREIRGFVGHHRSLRLYDREVALYGEEEAERRLWGRSDDGLDDHEEGAR